MGFYSSPVNDPWFKANLTGWVWEMGTSINQTVYQRYLPLNTLGCTEEHQLCSSNTSMDVGRCTPLMGINQLQLRPDGASSLGLSARQNVTYHRMLQAATDSSIIPLLNQLNQRNMPLLARTLVAEQESFALPDNQWELETEYWHSIAMAHLQRIFVEYGTGQIASDTKYLSLATTPDEKWMCDNLLVPGTAYQSFSILALVLVLIAGLLIVTLSFYIEDLVFFLQRHRHRGEMQCHMWQDSDMLQLQRMVYEELEKGTWQDGAFGIPVTKNEEMLPILTLKDRRDSAHHGKTEQHEVPATSQANLDSPPSDLQAPRNGIEASQINTDASHTRPQVAEFELTDIQSPHLPVEEQEQPHAPSGEHTQPSQAPRRSISDLSISSLDSAEDHPGAAASAQA